MSACDLASLLSIGYELATVSKPVAEVVRLLETLETLTNSATEVAFEMGTSKLCSVKIYTLAQ